MSPKFFSTTSTVTPRLAAQALAIRSMSARRSLSVQIRSRAASPMLPGPPPTQERPRRPWRASRRRPVRRTRFSYSCDASSRSESDCWNSVSTAEDSRCDTTPAGVGRVKEPGRAFVEVSWPSCTDPDGPMIDRHDETRFRRPVASLREVAPRAGVSLATASRVASGVDGVRAGDPRPGRGGDARPALRAARPEARRRARSACSSPSSRTRSSPRSPRRWRRARPRPGSRRSSATRRRARRSARPTTCTCSSTAGRRDDLHLLRDDAPRRRARPLRPPARGRRAARVRERRARGLRRPVRLRRRAPRRLPGDAAPDRARPPADRVRRRPRPTTSRRARRLRAHRGAAEGAGLAGRLVVHGDFTLEGGRAALHARCSSARPAHRG